MKLAVPQPRGIIGFLPASHIVNYCSSHPLWFADVSTPSHTFSHNISITPSSDGSNIYYAVVSFVISPFYLSFFFFPEQKCQCWGMGRGAERQLVFVKPDACVKQRSDRLWPYYRWVSGVISHHYRCTGVCTFCKPKSLKLGASGLQSFPSSRC